MADLIKSTDSKEMAKSKLQRIIAKAGEGDKVAIMCAGKEQAEKIHRMLQEKHANCPWVDARGIPVITMPEPLAQPIYVIRVNLYGEID